MVVVSYLPPRSLRLSLDIFALSYDLVIFALASNLLYGSRGDISMILY